MSLIVVPDSDDEPKSKRARIVSEEAPMEVVDEEAKKR